MHFHTLHVEIEILNVIESLKENLKEGSGELQNSTFHEVIRIRFDSKTSVHKELYEKLYKRR